MDRTVSSETHDMTTSSTVYFDHLRVSWGISRFGPLYRLEGSKPRVYPEFSSVLLGHIVSDNSTFSTLPRLVQKKEHLRKIRRDLLPFICPTFLLIIFSS